MAKRVEALSKLKQRYPKEWLLLTDVVADELTRPIKGKLVAHSKNRDDIYDRLARTRAKSVSVEYTGNVPKDLVVVFWGAGDQCVGALS
ncbi:MAG: hypothetical protein A3I71_03155 [Omnitrophica WOR_2 bacterium RIFCSPLOWO2_02_FULL_63_16]|nr:MAG: hypothetical protein A3I71_03155 [Omnitrophica WOR_2 bacterium RIFCSPLOWO2_02_FULL_63_16]